MIDCPHTAMVLAAGLGTRMRPLTETTAKPLLEVNGIALIDRILTPFIDLGVKRFVVNVHWCADKVEAHIRAFCDTQNVELVLSDERAEVLETGGALAKARHLLGDDPIFVINTDAFWSPTDMAPLEAMLTSFNPETTDAHLLLADISRALGFPGAGDFFCSDDGVLQRRGDASSAPWAYAGVRLIKPQLYNAAPVEPFSALKTWEPLLANGRIRGHCLDRFWLHVGTPDALADTEMWLKCHGD